MRTAAFSFAGIGRSLKVRGYLTNVLRSLDSISSVLFILLSCVTIVQSSAIPSLFEALSGKSAMWRLKRSGDRTEPCRSPSLFSIVGSFGQPVSLQRT